ncbi:hypothetical protein [Haloplanus rubicundus]|nr:hypothetical protein [Haloplanus rubicundus]
MSGPMVPRLGLVDRLRQPEYVGENRCIPCTVVNVLIALVLAGTAALVAPPLGVGVLVAALAAIYLRGYLVPYTPTLTKRYFPDRVLRWFDKDPTFRDVERPEDVEDIDVETLLYEMGVVTECEDIDDLCLEPAFQRAWRDEIESLRAKDSLRGDLLDLLGLDDEHEIEEYGDGARVVRVDGQHVGQWESDAALVADLAADEILAQWDDGWADLHVVNRSEVLSSLRLFLEQCPNCDAPVTIDQDRARSCCLAIEVAVMTCEACGARVFEFQLDEEL